MKVSDLKQQLERFTDDTELMVSYWDREFVSDALDMEITLEAWSEAVNKFQGCEFQWQSDAADCIVELIEEAS